MKKLFFIFVVMTSAAFASNKFISIEPINQYRCSIKELIFGEYSEKNAYYYYLPRFNFPAIPAHDNETACHDKKRYGELDSQRIPRLDERKNFINLWSSFDPMFYDNDGDSIPDLNNYLFRLVGDRDVLSKKYFERLNLPSPLEEDKFFSSGYFMYPWDDAKTKKSFCLTNKHYRGSNSLYRAFGKIIQRETEGLYVGRSLDGERKNYIYIKESQLKKVSFYFRNNIPTPPTENNVSSVSVYFNYPFDYDDPYSLKSYQTTFRVIASHEDINLPSNPGYPTHDRRIGCIPR